MHYADENMEGSEVLARSSSILPPVGLQELKRVEALYSLKLQEVSRLLDQIRQSEASSSQETRNCDESQKALGPDYIVRPRRAM